MSAAGPPQGANSRHRGQRSGAAAAWGSYKRPAVHDDVAGEQPQGFHDPS